MIGRVGDTMDQGRMRATVALLLSAEERLRIHRHLQDIDAALTRLDRAPKRAWLQGRAIKKLRLLASKLTKFEATLTSTQRKSLIELRALHFFSAPLLAEMLERIEMFPPAAVAVVRRHLRSFIVERAHFLSALQVLQGRFNSERDYPMLSTVTIAY